MEMEGKKSEVNKKQFDGSFIPKGRHDILTVAIGKPEHLGHVQGIRSRVSIRDIFGPPRQRNPSRLVTREEVTAMLAQAKAEVEVTLEVRLQKMKEEMLMQMSSQKVSNAPHTPSLTCHWSTKESNIVQLPSKDDPTPNLEQCFLYVENIKKCLVARGRIHEDVVKVTIEEVKIDDADIPFPTDKIKTVKRCQGHFHFMAKETCQDASKFGFYIKCWSLQAKINNTDFFAHVTLMIMRPPKRQKRNT
ncbi:uncharacterized protein LOC129299548 [Prosopis cineraria]|uniref:uncharacterized protein LOC129299548 n=1 Tax=Prosopis cineraria TaxID=364024 RepID=UPI0024103711|nr:uncharacterized protein LOC129299548 [Prosopis cineraria]